MKNLIKAIAFSFALMITVPLFAQEYHILVSPPALQTEVIPDQPFSGAVWQPGYFRYDPVLMNYTFESGKWVTPPSVGATWIAPTYQYSNGEYLFVPGRWVGTNGQILTVPRKDDDMEDQRERDLRNLKKIHHDDDDD